MISGVLILVALIAVVVLVLRKVTQRAGAGTPDGHAVRRFFQYLLLYGLLVVAAVGVSGLLGRLFDRSFAEDEATLALYVAFTVVGVPLYAGMALWSRRTFRTSATEGRSLGWAFYATAASLTSLGFAATAAYGLLAWATDLEPYSGSAIGQLLVWGAVWGVHWWLDGRVTPPDRSRPHHLLGSLAGLVTAATGLGTFLAGALAALLGLGSDQVLAGQDRRLLEGGIALVVGAAIWVVYWLLTAARSERESLWLGYVLLVGVGGGLATAIVAASTVLYTVLVWLLGDPGPVEAAVHFEGLPGGVGAAVVGVLAWWYHHAVLAQAASGKRTEVQRIYEYLMAGVSLLAAAAGLTMVLVALVEGVSDSGEVVVGESAVNTLLAATTLLVVGVPVWWFFWHRIQRVAAVMPAEEHAAPTRRFYLLVLFGVGGVAAVISLLVGVYLLIRDILAGTAGSATLFDVRFPAGILVSTAAISTYHWFVYREEREAVAPSAHGPRYVLLVGAPDEELVRAVARNTGGRVQAWRRMDDGETHWSADEVMTALSTTTEDEVIVLSDAQGLHAIPVHRSRGD